MRREEFNWGRENHELEQQKLRLKVEMLNEDLTAKREKRELEFYKLQLEVIKLKRELGIDCEVVEQ